MSRIKVIMIAVTAMDCQWKKGCFKIKDER